MSSKAFTIPSIFTAIDKFTTPIQKMGSAATSFYNKVNNGISSATRQMFAFASAAALVAAILGGIAFSGRAILDYETAVQSFRTIVSNLNDADFLKYEKKIAEVATITKKSSIDVAKAFEVIAGLDAKLAETPAAIGSVTQAAITLAKASRDDLDSSASNLVGIMNQFNLAASEADRVINVLAAGQAVGASTIKQTADAFTVFGAVAKDANLTLEESVGLVEVLASKQIQGAEAGTALRGTILALQKAQLGYNNGLFNTRDALVELNTKLSKLTTAKQKDALMEKVFGVINRTTGTILTQNIALFDEMTNGVAGTSEAYRAAEINANTLANKLAELRAKWITMVTTSERTSVSLQIVKKVVVLLTNNLETIAAVILITVGVLLAFKTVMVAINLVMFIMNVRLGIMAVGQAAVSVAVGKSTVALAAYKTATAIATAANWLFNASNPVGWIMILIGLVTVMIAKWNEWGAALSAILGPLGFVVSLIQSFRRNWDMITEAFSKGGVLAGFKAIGKVILDSILMPMQQVYLLIHKLTGAESFRNAALGVEALRKSLGVNTSTDENGNALPAISTRAAEREAARAATEGFNKTYSSKLVIVDETGRAKMDNDNPMISMPETSSTLRRGFGVYAN